VSYYQGDFYQGDPGFFSFLGNVAKTAVGFIPGVGPIASKAIGALGGVRKALPSVASRAGTMVMKHPVLTGAAAAGTIGMMGGGVGRATARMGAAGVGPMSTMRGYHMEKRGKRAGQMIRNRRMHVTNVKALRRAIRRCSGFAHLAKKVLRFTSPRPPRGRGVFKHRRRKKTI
jgi:hypothetical protein